MAIFPVKYPRTITIIERGAPLVLVIFAGHGVCCKIFGIWNNMLLIEPLCKLLCGILGWVPTRAIYLWPAVFLYITLLSTLVTSHICLERRPSSRDTTIYTLAALEVNLIQILVDRIINVQYVCLWKWRLALRILFAGSWFPPLWINNMAVFTSILLYNIIICDEILWWYDIHITHTKFLDKIRNLLVLMNLPKTEYGVRITLKDSSDVT